MNAAHALAVIMSVPLFISITLKNSIQAVFILKRDPITSSPIQESLNTILDTPQLSTPPLNNLKTPYTNPGKFTTNSRTYCSHHIRKPRNAWIIFRQEMMVKFRAQIGHLHTSEQSKVISKMWKKTPRHTKEFYTTLAHKEKADLLAQYPNYRVQPRKSSEIRKRIKNKYPSNLTTQNLNQWILDNGVQLRSAFSQDLQSKISFSSSDLINLEAKRSDTIHIQSNNFRNSLPSRISPSKILLSGKARTQAQILAAHSELDIDTND
ncbi:putative mating-type protein mat a-1 [Erysiphe necator]|nr:putative mating-type protein mat a-1 [Erysiphe necator]